ncbi:MULTISPECIES: cupin domain-containing protein [unclassified Haladaptatus]|uniref:cupin domain-containing protein n=1 Tax=unclassified Haladaptatus TaxID=2622732 RepID=UPI00209C1144|nr:MULTISPECIES: cupin domain-containing protein [unclassified Haladaptatus]MCO8246506.1 cupin domain-containing protein [Haladaptatus sp. AB643]MCO8254744.1 cupin domain-containing protein [Haladaptatus sp. AB618]
MAVQSRDEKLQSVPLYQFEGTDVWQEGDDHARLRGYFPLSPGTPQASEVAGEDIMLVCIELEPDNYLPTHRDSNEELLHVTAGTVEATVGDETIELSTGEIALVPAEEPHSIRNVGRKAARILGIFPNDELTATFEKPMEPFGTNVITIGPDAEME